MNQFFNIGVGSLDLDGVQVTFCEYRREHWWQRPWPAIIVFYRDDGDNECEFRFLPGQEAKRDTEHQRIVQALNEYSRSNSNRRGSSQI